jgi:hypothetical protein
MGHIKPVLHASTLKHKNSTITTISREKETLAAR